MSPSLLLCVVAVAASALTDDVLPPMRSVDVNAYVAVGAGGVLHEMRVFVPAGAPVEPLAAEVCGGIRANTTQCHDSVVAQVERRRHPRMLYRRWVDSEVPGKRYLMTFEVYEGTPTRDAVIAACDASIEVNPNLPRDECLRLAVAELETMRIEQAWKTKIPETARADIAPFWRAVAELENGVEERGHMIYDGHTAHCPQKIKFFFDVMKNSPDVTQVCEVGFNAGHSALAWLVGLPNTKVLSFDLGVHEYVTVARDVLQARYPGRLELVLGDSAVTVPQYLRDHPGFKCNVIFIDGAHKYQPVVDDILNFAAAADHTYGHLLIMDDFGCVENYCRNVRSAFYKMVHEFRVQERGLITTEEYTHIVGGGKAPVTNGMASGIYLADGYRQELLAAGKLLLHDP